MSSRRLDSPQWRSSLAFGSFLANPPRPTTEEERKVRNFVLGLKEDRGISEEITSSQYVARRLSEEAITARDLHDLLDGAVLVPVPKSAPLTSAPLAKGNPLWASRRIADALREEGFGIEVAPIVVRKHAIRQSHSAEGPSRPWPDQHQESVEVKRALPIDFSGKIILVDDVVTRGSTLLGCALAILESYPDASVSGFAVARTLKQGELMEGTAIQPVTGTIRWRDGWIDREP